MTALTIANAAADLRHLVEGLATVMDDATYAAMLLWSVEPTDRALAGWGNWQNEQAAEHLRDEAKQAELRRQRERQPA